MHIIRTAILGLIFLAQAQASAFAEKRVALVIGNSAYQNVPPLGNPVRDAAVVVKMFKDAQFDVVVSRNDLSALEMRRTLRDFADKSSNADMAVIYYAGHGMEVDGTNYLVPIDAKLERDTDVYDEAFALDRLLVAVEPARQLRLIILDACRDNPFLKMTKQANSSRSIGRGLAKIEPSSPNTMVAFAAKAGSTALDGGGKNSPFAIALVDHLTTPGLDLRKAFGFVRDDVLKATNNRQEPFVYGSLGGNDVALVPLPTPPAPVAAAPASPPADSARTQARGDYELAEHVGTRAAWEAFINDYPAGFYTDLAKVQRDKAIAEDARVAATQRAKAAADEKVRLAAEGAKAAEQAKAAAAAKVADDARIAAEKNKAAEDEKLAAAERAKSAALAKTAGDKPPELIASLAAQEPAATDARSNAATAIDVPRLLQLELRRVGCNPGSVDGNWNGDAQKSLGRFNRNAGTKLDVKVASIDALDVVKSKQGRICPLICEDGFRADGERCVRITCRAGYELGDDNSCQRIEPKKKRSPREAEPMERPRRPLPEAQLPMPPQAAARAPQPSGQIICNGGGCRPVARGCHLEIAGYSNANGMGGQTEVCR
jgi:uncharacterized caspase-like protein